MTDPRTPAAPLSQCADSPQAPGWRITLLLLLTYPLLGAAGFLLGAPSPVFPPAGLALAAMLWYGRRALPGVWLGAVALNLGINWLGSPWLGATLDPTQAAVTAVIAAGATAQAWIGSWLVGRWQGDAWRRLEFELDAVRFLLLGGVLAGGVSATIGSGGLSAAGLIDPAEFLFTWWTWYVGDVIGILVFAPLTLALLNRPDALWRERRHRILTPLLVTLALAIMAFHSTAKWERLQWQDHVRETGETIARDIGNRLRTHREVLSALRRFVEATPDLTFAQFKQFTGPALSDNPDLLGLSFNALVSDAQRPTFEARMSRGSPLGSFYIMEWDSEQRLVRAGSRPEYAPVTYIAPLEKNKTVLGFDNYSEPVRRTATERALTTRSLTVAAPIRLVQEPTSSPGMLELLTVEDPAATDQDGRPRLLGFVVAVARIETLIAIATQGEVFAGLLVQLRDAQALDQPTGAVTLLYGSQAAPGECKAGAKFAASQTHLRAGDRDWVLTLCATPAYLHQHRSWAAWAVGVVGLVFAALLQVLMLGITGRAHLIQRQNTALQASEAAQRDLNVSLDLKVAQRTAEVRAAQVRLEAMINALPDLMFRIDRSGCIHDFHSSALDKLYLTPDRFLGKRVSEVLPAPASAVIMAAVEEAASQGRHQGGVYSLPLPQGELWYELSIAILGDAVQAGDHFVMLAHDITRRVRAEQQIQALNVGLEQRVAERTAALRESEDHLRLATEGADLGTMFWDFHTNRLDCSERCKIHMALPPGQEPRMDDFFAALHPDDREPITRQLRHALKSLEDYAAEYRVIQADGAVRWISALGRIYCSVGGSPQAMGGITLDITARKQAEQDLHDSERRFRELSADLELKVEERTAELRDANAELNRLATTDSLTGVWNRRYFEQAVADALARHDRYGEPLSMLLLDIDRFKAVNDRYGHQTGDEVLVELTQRVRRQLRASDVLARWGGEEFVVMMPHCGAPVAAEVAEKLRILVATRPFPIIGRITLSFGIAQLHPAEDFAAWFKRVDDALYAAKASGRNRVCVSEAAPVQ